MKIPVASAKPKNGRVVVRWNWMDHQSHEKQIFFFKRVKRRTFQPMVLADFLTIIARLTLIRTKEVHGITD